jgi:nucleotide-binding universal stress UspA family protein|tara:strand:- start:547 stop:963 length:417 start_codon:yes stop_codon:yes gene_type:complete
MVSGPKKIMVALVARGDEKSVIEQAVILANKFEAQLTVIHVHQPVLSQPKGGSELNVTEEIIRNRFTKYGFGQIVNDLAIIITKGENIPEKIQEHINDIDMLVVGHKKMGGFIASIMDSVDEGISNLISCPVLVVQKD